MIKIVFAFHIHVRLMITGVSLQFINIFLGPTKSTVNKLKDSMDHFIFDNTVSNKFSANLIHFLSLSATLTYPAI